MTFPPLPQGAIPPTQSGAFYEWSGQGISLHVDDDGEYSGHWFTYGKDGARRWYGFYGGGGMNPAVYTTHSGRFNEPGYSEEPIGNCRIYMFPDGTGVFNYHDVEHGRGSVILKKRLMAQSGGVYYDPTISGQGWSIHTFDIFDQKIASAYWFTYDHNGNQKWFIASGLRMDTMGEIYDLTIYECFNGVFGYPQKVIEEDVGSAELLLLGNKALISYDLDAVVIKAAGKYSLVRL